MQTSDEIMDAAVEVMMKTCEEQGLSRSDVRRRLGLKFLVDDSREYQETRRLNPTALDIAWKKAFDAFVAKNAVLHAKYCQEWLMLKCDARIGDSVQVCAWATPRNIRLENFKIEWQADSLEVEPYHIRDAFLVFEGPWLNGGPRNAHKTCHVAKVEDTISKLI